MSRLHDIIRVTGGGRVAYTNTSTIPDLLLVAEIRALAKEIDLDGVIVHAKKNGERRRSAGYAYDGIPGMANLDGLAPARWQYLIVVTDCGDWVDTLAHEAKHIEQFRHGLDVSERPANAFAAWWVRKRKKTPARVRVPARIKVTFDL